VQDTILTALTRRGLIGGATAATMVGSALAARPKAARDSGREQDRDPDLGPNVLIVDPAHPGDAQARIEAIFREQETAEFGDGRHAILLKPGRHALDINVGFYTQVAGLGAMPHDVVVDGHVHAEADWNKGVALVNFWRGVENLAVRPRDGMDRWAVSQASPYRRVDLDGDLVLDDGGWSSGGFMADCRVRGTVRSGTQQQWLTRGSAIGGWQGSNWNMVFVGVEGAPATSFPEPPCTTVATMPRIREKPFLTVDATGRWGVFLPALRTDATGPSWTGPDATGGKPAGRTIPLSRFFIARPEMDAATINAALARGQHLLVTPGRYHLRAPIRVDRPGTIVLGLGLATLIAQAGSAAMLVADVPGVTIAGLLFDAGPVLSPVLLRIGRHGGSGGRADDPVLLADLFFRVGGSAVGRVETALEIHSRHVIGDHLWIWRADHGDRRHGRVHVGWAESTGEHGLVVQGDDVTIYGLFVEHFRQWQTIWAGERGRTFFYQNELPYDPPSQSAWRADSPRGWAAYKVADAVRDHRAIGLGVYANFTADPSIALASAIEAPRTPGVTFTSVTTISLGNGKGTIAHPVNDAGEAARPGAIRQTLVRYPLPEAAR
jgi:hypothetical protein